MRSFSAKLKELKNVLNRFDPESTALRTALLKQISGTDLRASFLLKEYHQMLLFICGYPANEEQLSLAEKELRRIAILLKRMPASRKTVLRDSGLPYTDTVSSFSPDLLDHLQNNDDVRLFFHSVSGGRDDLRAFVRYSLPEMIREISTEESWSTMKLLRTVFGRKENFVRALVSEYAQINAAPALRDQLFEKIGLYVRVSPRNENLSLAFNRITAEKIFFHDELLKKFDHEALLRRKLPPVVRPEGKERGRMINAIRHSLVLLGRETEPSTWMDENAIHVFHLERGITIAFYGMSRERRQPLESYFGFTAFKNGMPMSYGGAWLFGKRALFGMNIFEWFRGGESAYVFCQLLRTYSRYFGIDYFEVEPYQYGKHNPEGIASGAFWFYYRFGFRPVNDELRALAETESAKIEADKKYRSSHETLRRFTASNIGLHLSNKKKGIHSPAEIRLKICAMIAQEYGGDTSAAQKHCVEQLMKEFRLKTGNVFQRKVLQDLALLLAADRSFRKKINDKRALAELIELKTTDEAVWQKQFSELMK